VLDLAVPRDVTADSASVDGVFLYNVDDLEAVVAEHAMARSRELEVCNTIISEETRAFLAGFRQAAAGPLIEALTRRARQIKQTELERIAPQLEALQPEARREIEMLADRLVNKLLHPQIVALKDAVETATPEQLRALERALGLDTPAPAPAPDTASATEAKP
jgi:glutamyl-tRNA reductase